MKIKLTKALIAILSVTFALTSCSKTSDELASVASTKQDILTFKTVEEFNTTVQKVNSMKPEERSAWEKSKGFKSFGTICDEVYNRIDPTKFKSLQEVKDTVAALNVYLEMGQNKDGKFYVDPKENSNPNRNLINIDKMYIIKDSVFKQFDNGIVAASISNIEKLKQMKSIEVAKTDCSVSIRQKTITYGYASGNYLNYFEQWGVNGNYAIRIRLNTYLIQGLRQHDYTFNNYKWTLWTYWGDYLSHTSSNLHTTTSDDYVIDPGNPYSAIGHRPSMGAYYCTNDYAVTCTFQYITPSLISNTPYYTHIDVYASNGQSCVINETYNRP